MALEPVDWQDNAWSVRHVRDGVNVNGYLAQGRGLDCSGN